MTTIDQAPIAIHAADAPPPVAWAIGELTAALGRRALPEVISGARVLHVLAPGGEPPRADLPRVADAFAILPDADGLTIWGASPRGTVYALLELADRLVTAEGARDPLALDTAIVEAPIGRTRSLCRYFQSEIEDKAWFYDEEMWREYLTMLVSNRFTRFSLGLGLQYNYPYYNRLITDVYFYFAYPFLVDVPGSGVTIDGLTETERARNLAMLRFIGDEAAKRGLEFQLGLWTHGCDFDDVPNASHQIHGITSDNHAAYCRDALKAIVAAVPGLTGVTLRVHVEAGIGEGSYAFWRTVMSGLSDVGRTILLDVHAKGTDLRMIDIALGVGQPVVVSPKFMAEHTGLPYHQASVRVSELPTAEKVGAIFTLSEGSRRFLRYGYGDLLTSERRFDVLTRVWPGTQRVLLSADPALAAGYGRAGVFCGMGGIEFSDPLSFKGRMGSGRPGARYNYAGPDGEALRTRYDWQKYVYGLRLLGRLAYNPDAERDTWMRYLRAEAGAAADGCEQALANASRILPLFTNAHGASACNNTYWPEIYDNMSVVYPPQTYPYGYDSAKATRFGTVPSFDRQLFANAAETAEALLAGALPPQFTALDVADWLEGVAAAAEAGIRAAEVTVDAKRPAVRRMLIDAAIQANLGRFFAARFRSATAFELYHRTGLGDAYTVTRAHYLEARRAWVDIIHTAEGVYQSDLAYGIQPWLRGDWAARLPGIDRDIDDLDYWYINDRDRHPDDPATAKAALDRLTAWRGRASVALDGDLPATFAPAQPLTIRIASTGAGAATLHYRRVNQSELWHAVAMMPAGGGGFEATIPADYTATPFPLQYYVSLEGDVPALAPGLSADLCSVPYRVVMPDAA